MGGCFAATKNGLAKDGTGGVDSPAVKLLELLFLCHGGICLLWLPG